jgi:hypothetical protein
MSKNINLRVVLSSKRIVNLSNNVLKGIRNDLITSGTPALGYLKDIAMELRRRQAAQKVG